MAETEENRVECLRKLDTVIKSHREQRYNLELALEVAPREEVSLREGRSCKDLSREVEACLAAETRSFFSRLSQSNIKRWAFLQQKVAQEKEYLIQLVRDKCRHLLVGMGEAYISREVTAIDLEIESMRLEKEYNLCWQEIEMFHISEAFKSQKNRIDVEWGAHLDSLNEAYDRKMQALTGCETASTSRATSATKAAAGEGRWHHAEKQKTLIHTAPVLSPSNGGMAAGSGVHAVRKRGKDNPSNRAEIDRVEKQHKAMVTSLLAQKANAVRWMRHQETRLVSQVQETHASRAPIAALLQSECALLEDFRALLLAPPHQNGQQQPQQQRQFSSSQIQQLS